MNNKLVKLTEIFTSEKYLSLAQFILCLAGYVYFATYGNWVTAYWCALAALMTLFYYKKVACPVRVISQADLEADAALSEAVDTIREYVRRRNTERG